MRCENYAYSDVKVGRFGRERIAATLEVVKVFEHPSQLDLVDGYHEPKGSV